MLKHTVHANRIALIDADGILYAAALQGQVDCDGSPIQLRTLDAVYADCLERIEQQVGWAEAEDAFIILSDRRNFRTDILPAGRQGSQGLLGYKGQRKATARPIVLDQLRAKVVEEAPYKTLLIKGLEADDVCGISAGNLQKAGKETVIVSPDKDLLQIPGLVCTPYKGKVVWTEVDKARGDRWHQTQTLVGDTCDNYTGCPGFGPTKAGILLDRCYKEGYTESRIWGEILDQFLRKGLTREDCLVQAQVSRILRATDWDATKKEPILFQLPL